MTQLSRIKQGDEWPSIQQDRIVDQSWLSRDPLVLSGEGVFYLPDKIDISEGPPSVEPSRTPEALENRLSGPTIQHRVAVRGHWRRPPPRAGDQRLRWVRPHFRGPRDAVLLEREYRLGDGEKP